MLKIVRASVLLVLLAVSASAGETPNNVTGQSAPPPPTPIMTQEPTDAEALPEPTQETTADGFGETLLNLLDSVLALF